MKETKETQKKPTAMQVEVLMNDWFRNLRQDNTYVHKSTKGVIRQKGARRSEYLLGPIKNNDIIEAMAASRSIAQNIVNSMTSVPVQVKVGGNGSACNGREINVATDYFNDSRLSLQQKLNLLIGFSIHEACHVNHTDFAELRQVIKSSDSEQIRRLKMDISNILDDERIEYLLGDDEHPDGDAMPGFSEFLEDCKEYVFGKYSKGLDDAAMSDPILKFLNTLTAIVRYPAILTEDIVESQYDNLLKVKQILTPFPLTHTGVMNATEEILKVIMDMVKEEMKEEQKQQDSQQGSDGQPSGNQGTDNQSQSSDASQESQPGPQKGKGKQPTAKEVQKRLEEKLNKNDAQKLLQNMERIIQAPDGNNAAKEIRNNPNEAQYVNGDADKEQIQGSGAGSGRTAYMLKAESNPIQYKNSVNRIKKYIPSMSKSLKCKTTDKDYELRGMDSGKLNTNKLVSLKTGNVNIFSRKGTITCDSACVCILIDESGSMSSRLNATRDAAVLINEAVKKIPNLELFSYGFTDDEMNIYCERNKADRYALGSIRSSGGTPTGMAMQVAGQRIRRMTQSQCLMLVLTDGAPDNQQKVKEQDKLLRKQGIIPVGVGIQNAPVHGLFQDAVSINNLSSLAPELGKLMKKRLLKSLKTKVADE